MYLDQIVAAQKRGEAKGITSVCSAHPEVIRQTLRICETHRVAPLIESTCNQVNQFGGYTGMTPVKFVDYLRGIAGKIEFPFENIILGGDHLGPSVWQNESAELAMRKAKELVRDYVQAGFVKIHLDCSMRLADDPPGPLDMEVSAQRAAQLAKAAEAVVAERSQAGTAASMVSVRDHAALRYVIGTEVPVPGGALGPEDAIRVTKVEEARQSIEVTREAFLREGLAAAWGKVIGLVVQPGVEFGDDGIHSYQPEAARELSKFIESEPLVFEAHSTDYQTPETLKDLVRDHFAIVKVGPALTFAYREAIFALAAVEDELFPEAGRSNIVHVLDQAMLEHPEYWRRYYVGNEAEQAWKRRFSLSDRIRYYWTQPDVQSALYRLRQNLGARVLPDSLLIQHVGPTGLTADQVIEYKLDGVLRSYLLACGASSN